MSRRLAIWLAIVVVFIGLIIAASVNGSAADVQAGLTRDGVTYDGSLVQEGADSDSPRVAMIPIVGAITNGDSTANGASTGSEDVVRMLDEIAANEDQYSGVILELDTPGGAVLAAQEIHDAIERLEHDTDLPVLAWARDVTASAGYYIAAPADRIVAASTTLTGSIGVILEYYEAAELADKVGVKSVVIKSGKLKDMGNPLRAITPEERAVLQSVIDEAYDQFVGVVSDGRKLSEAKVRKLADGRIYSGRQAKQLGLVDELGLRRDAYDAMAKLIDDGDDGEDLAVVEYSRRFGLFDALGASASPTLASLQNIGDAASVLSGKRSSASAMSGTGVRAGNGLVDLQYRAEIG
jgi:protease-4